MLINSKENMDNKYCYFEETPLGIHAKRNVNRDNFIDKFNNFWVWENNITLWGKLGRPDPFDDGDISIAKFMEVQMKGELK